MVILSLWQIFPNKKKVINVSVFGRFLGVTLNNRYGAGTGRIWLDNVNCSGSETDIGKCLHKGWGSHNCDHRDDVSVRCINGSAAGVRLSGSGLPHEGRLEVYYNGQWGTVCDDGFDDNDATVACRNIGTGFVVGRTNNHFFGLFDVNRPIQELG